MRFLRSLLGRPWVRILVVGGGLIGGVLVVAALVAGLRLARTADDLRRAEQLLQDGAAKVEQGDIAAGKHQLEQATRILTDANTGLYNRIEFELIEWIPPVGDNLSVLRESIGVTLTLADGGVRVLDAGSPLVAADGRLEVPLAEGEIPIDAVVDVGKTLDQVASSLRGAEDMTRSRFLVSDVTEVRDRVLDEVALRRDHFGALGRALDVISDMAGANGDRRYLIAVANTAEMRGTGGMILSYGVLEGSNGTFDTSAWGEIDELLLPGPVTVDPAVVPDDYVARWQGFDPLGRWRNATMSPDLTLTAPVLAAMYEGATGSPIDGVIHIDPAGLAAILEGTGPVAVEGLGRVTADNVVDLVLNQAYILYPESDERRDVLTDVSEEVFDKLVTGDYNSLRPLVTALVDSTRARHIMAWSRSGRMEGHFRYFGVDGSLPRPDLNTYTLTVQNASANKLDYYVDTALALEGDVADGGALTATIDIANTVSPDMTEPRYIVGHVDDDQPIGNYRGIVSLYVPAGTTVVDSRGATPLDGPVVQAEGGRTVIGFTVDVPAGEQVSVTIELDLPPGVGPEAVILTPTPRVRPTTVTIDADFGAGRITGDTALDQVSILTVEG